MILSLMKKSIVIQTEGVFTNSLSKPKLFHASFTNFVFESDYLLTETKLKAIKSPHVFVSSVINESNPVFLNINYTNLSHNFSFGIIAHSVEHNKKISIKYSSQESMFFINGEKASEYKLQANASIEILYLPSQNLVSFADSIKDRKVIISVDLAQKLKCSFFVLVYPDSEFEYECDLTPKTNCFIYHQNNKFANINKDVQVISLLFQKDYTEELEGIIHYSREFKEIKYSQKKLLNNDELISFKRSSTTFTLTEFKSLPETDLFMAQYQNSYFYSLISNVCSSPNQLNQYLQIHDISGTFSLIQPERAIIENSDSIPAFNIQKYHNLPSEILNSYIDEACEFYQKEIMTLFAVQVFANSKDIYSILKQFSMSTLAVVNFITSVLFLLEQINFSNLNENKSPIDFLNYNGFVSCSKTDLYDYFSALTQIIDFVTKNNFEKFTYKWFNQLQEDFRSKYMHFVSQKNNNIINVRSSIIDSYQTFDLEDVSGWIIFPYKFGCYSRPGLLINRLIFPKLASDKANYIYSEAKILKIKANYTSLSSDDNNKNLTTFGIIPLSNKSNESLFYSFYHLAVSFKYFVLFVQDKIPVKMKYQIWKLVINSIAAGSPFFFSHSYDVLLFLQKKIQIYFNEDSIALLNSLYISNYKLNNPSIVRFLSYQSFWILNNTAKVLKEYVFEKNEKPPSDIVIKSPIIPSTIDNKTNTGVLAEVVASVLLYKENEQEMFPYNLVFHEWLESFIINPPSIVENISPNVIKVTFLAFIPDFFSLAANGFFWY